MNLFLKKDLNRLIADANDTHTSEGATMKRHLSATSLTLLGIGAIVGAGIFSITGVAAANYAGPGVVYSFMISAVLCALAGLCYAEMAAMVPVAGSAYSYSYATMGELIAWIIGWDLILEYAFGSVTVAASWSGYLVSLVQKTLGVHISDSIMQFTRGPWELVTLSDGSQVYGTWNMPATFVALLVGCILYKGIKESAIINNIIVFIKVTIILSFIALGWGVVDSNLWVANPNVTGFWSLIPPEALAFRHGESIPSFGWSGILTGAGVVFFAYIGFDAISTTAQEARNPKRDLPIGILASLLICTVLYVAMCLVMTGVVSYKELGVPDPVAVGVDRIVTLRGWSPQAKDIFSFFVKLGALSGLTSVVLVLMLGQTRVFYAMAKDRLLPWFDSIHPKHQTPHIATAMTSVFVALCAGCMPMSLVGELVSIGTILAFALVCIGVLILRVKHPETPRPFRTPAVWLIAPAGTIACGWVMSGLPHDTWLRLVTWLVLGFVVYFAYGYRNSKLRKSPGEQEVGSGSGSTNNSYYRSQDGFGKPPAASLTK